jgi:hypothetical protein
VKFSKCEFEECERKETCERYTKAVGSVINFKAICPDYEYRWYEPDKEKMKEIELKPTVKNIDTST